VSDLAVADAGFASDVGMIKNLAQISDERSRIRHDATPHSVRPGYGEPLLSGEAIRTAVARIGPRPAQAFYRRLAGSREPEARMDAALRLAEGLNAATEENLPILRALAGDPEARVAATASVSLLVLGHDEVQERILSWLAEASSYHDTILSELRRVTDGGRLTFARSALERIAASAGGADAETAQTLLDRMLSASLIH
jgi:hypothetical protein